MISLLSDILEILLLVLKSLFRVVKKKKHENRSQEQTEERPSGPPNTRSVPPLCEEQGTPATPHKPRKRRKSITETVTRTITVESMGSSSTGSPGPDTDQKTSKVLPKSN